jgi:hypothetical protein
LARHLTDSDIARVVEILDGWKDEVLSWDLLCKACLPVIGTIPARQTLYRSVRLHDAFKGAKKRLKSGPGEVGAPPSMRIAMQRIARLEIEKERLTQDNGHLIEQFFVWQYNAHVRGMSDKDLNKRLPPVDRGNS